MEQLQAGKFYLFIKIIVAITNSSLKFGIKTSRHQNSHLAKKSVCHKKKRFDILSIYKVVAVKPVENTIKLQSNYHHALLMEYTQL